MKCPKCQGDVVEIRGNYYCSQCGETVDLDQVKQGLEQKMQRAKGKTKEKVEEGQEKTQKDSSFSKESQAGLAAPSVADSPESSAPELSKEPKAKNMPEQGALVAKENVESDKFPEPGPVSMPSMKKIPKPNIPPGQPYPKKEKAELKDVLPKVKEPVNRPKETSKLVDLTKSSKEIKVPNNHLKKAVKLRILLIAVIVLNILIISGIVYLLVIR